MALDGKAKAELLTLLGTPGRYMRSQTVKGFQMAAADSTESVMYGACWLLAGLCERTGLSPAQVATVLIEIQQHVRARGEPSRIVLPS